MESITLGSHEGGNSSKWVKSSLSFANGNCVEVAQFADGEVGVRNSRHPDGAVLRFTADEWHAFLGGARKGEFDGFGKLDRRDRRNRSVAAEGSHGAPGNPPLLRTAAFPAPCALQGRSPRT